VAQSEIKQLDVPIKEKFMGGMLVVCCLESMAFGHSSLSLR